MEISDRDPKPKWDFQEPVARPRPWLRELSFWRHDTSEVLAEVALYQTMSASKGTFVEYTSQISNKLREMESGFKESLPPKLKGFYHQATGQVDP